MKLRESDSHRGGGRSIFLPGWKRNDCISEHLMYRDCAETLRTIISNYKLHEHKTWPPNEVLSLVGSRNANKGDEITFNFSTFPQTKHVRQTKQYLLNFCFQCHLSNSCPCQSAAYGAPKKCIRTHKNTLFTLCQVLLNCRWNWVSVKVDTECLVPDEVGTNLLCTNHKLRRPVIVTPNFNTLTHKQKNW